MMKNFTKQVDTDRIILIEKAVDAYALYQGNLFSQLLNQKAQLEGNKITPSPEFIKNLETQKAIYDIALEWLDAIRTTRKSFYDMM